MKSNGMALLLAGLLGCIAGCGAVDVPAEDPSEAQTTQAQSCSSSWLPGGSWGGSCSDAYLCGSWLYAFCNDGGGGEHCTRINTAGCSANSFRNDQGTLCCAQHCGQSHGANNSDHQFGCRF